MNFPPRTLIVSLAIASSLWLALSAPTSYAADGWRAGAASRIITPAEPMWMAGYGGRDAPSNGKLSELYAKALVLTAGDTTGVVITLDLVGIDRTLAHRIKESIGKKLTIDPNNVVIATSHTHSGPVVGLNLPTMHYYQLNENFRKQIDAYAERLHSDCVSAAEEAAGKRVAAQVSWAMGSADFATNRRNNKEPEVPRLRAEGKLVGPFDFDVPVLAAHDNDGKLIAVLFGYACHSTVLSGMQWSADYPGYAQSELESRHPGCVALFYAGCGADQNPLPRRTPELARHYGQRLAIAVDRVLMTTTMHKSAPRLQCRYAEAAAPLATLPTKEEIEKQLKSTNKYEAVRAERLLEQLASGKPLSQTYPYPVSLWQIGDDVKWVALGGEVVVDYALRVKSELQSEKNASVWVAGYAHDVMAYIPSRRVLAEGGYEGGGSMVLYGLPCFWAPELEETIIKQVLALAKQ